GGYEKETITEILAHRKNAKISVWNRMNVADIRHSLDCKPDIVHISVPVSYTQIYAKLRKNKTWLVGKARECVDFALAQGVKEVTVGFEDASRADSAFMISVALMLREMGIRRIRYADTVGVLTPSRTSSSIAELITNTGMEIEMHSHNDLGMAVANSIAAAKAGAEYIDTTIMGIGERTGNCDMQRFLHAAKGLFTLDMNRMTALVIEDKCLGILGRV
ncbi:MAG: homocitrate synthase, partial [Acetanaerobacterium sp.]